METVLATLEVTAEFAYNVKFNKERIQASLPAGHLDATTLADYLVYKVRGRWWGGWSEFYIWEG